MGQLCSTHGSADFSRNKSEGLQNEAQLVLTLESQTLSHSCVFLGTDIRTLRRLMFGPLNYFAVEALNSESKNVFFIGDTEME